MPSCRRIALVLGTLTLGACDPPPDGVEARGEAAPLPAGSNPGSFEVCPGQPYASLQAAVDAAPSGATIRICPGDYFDTLDVRGKELTIRATGGAALTTINGGPLGPATLRLGEGARVRLEGVTLTHHLYGNAIVCEDSSLVLAHAVVRDVHSAEHHHAGRGGGMYARRCALDIDDVTFRNNEVQIDGGGAYLEECTGEIRNSRFLDNVANGGGLFVAGGAMTIRGNELRGNTGYYGGALNLGGLGEHHADRAGRAVVEGNVIEENVADGWGGGVYAGHHEVIDFRDNVVARNTARVAGGMYLGGNTSNMARDRIVANTAAQTGGGLYVEQVGGTFTDVEVRDNRSDGSAGGMSLLLARITFERLQVRDNTAAAAGGGIGRSPNGCRFLGGEITGNRAASGGGVQAELAGAGVLEMIGTRIHGNHADTYGGGISLANNRGAVELRGVALEDNLAAYGGGIATTATPLDLRNVQLARNQASAGGALWVGANPEWSGPCNAQNWCPPLQPDVRLELATLHGNDAADGAAIWLDAPRLLVRGAILDGNTGGAQVAVRQPPPRGSVARPFPVVTWQYSDTFPATFDGIADPTGTDGNLAVPPRFVEPGGGDFHLAPDSPCIDAGPPELLDADGSRADMGRWGGAQP